MGALWTVGILALGQAASWASAKTIDNLGRFLEDYVGDCASDDPSFDAKGCEARAEAWRKRVAGQLHKVEIEVEDQQLQLAGFDAAKSAFRLHLTPFFAERGLALTAGKPDKDPRSGRPLVRNLPIWVKIPAGETQGTLQRELERGPLRLELLFRPGPVWAISRKGGGESFRGAAVTLASVRVYASRRTAPIAEQSL